MQLKIGTHEKRGLCQVVGNNGLIKIINQARAGTMEMKILIRIMDCDLLVLVRPHFIV